VFTNKQTNKPTDAAKASHRFTMLRWWIMIRHYYSYCI